MNDQIKDSVAKVLANKIHWNNVETFAQTVFRKYCNDNPKEEGSWRTYKKFQIFDENYIRINYEFGAGDIKCSCCIFIDLNTNKITEAYE